MKSTITLGIAAVLIGLTGLLHGMWTDRWAVSRDPEEASAWLQHLPATVGDWSSEPIPVRRQELPNVSSWMVRRYTHRGNGASLSVSVVAGRPGPVSVHTPDMCYVGSGYELVNRPTRLTVATAAGSQAEFNVGRFRKDKADGVEQLRIFWAWSTGEGWQVPANPRLTFARYPVLYKLYVVRPLVRGNEALDDDPAVSFLRVFLPQLDQARPPRP
ncbi:MAG: EpsI family protein [Gemmataceae bacterium]|nr:EpsI family protein [Gemmataceae bacterium]MDW8266964.1 exosortase-associated EpsI family protein [Gemmataceae bacterium]